MICILYSEKVCVRMLCSMGAKCILTHAWWCMCSVTWTWGPRRTQTWKERGAIQFFWSSLYQRKNSLDQILSSQSWYQNHPKPRANDLWDGPPGETMHPGSHMDPRVWIPITNRTSQSPNPASHRTDEAANDRRCRSAKLAASHLHLSGSRQHSVAREAGPHKV